MQEKKHERKQIWIKEREYGEKIEQKVLKLERMDSQTYALLFDNLESI